VYSREVRCFLFGLKKQKGRRPAPLRDEVVSHVSRFAKRTVVARAR